MESVVELSDVTKRYGPTRALDGVSLAVPPGTFVAVMGATGSGKSTLLHCAAGLDRPTTGRIRLAGRDITRMRERPLTRLRRDRVGFVFQAYNLLSALTVRQNVLLPSRLGGDLKLAPRSVEKHVSAIFTKLDLPPAETDHRRVLAVLRYLNAHGVGSPHG